MTMGRHRWLLRAFPRRWRARYGAELEDLLADMGSDGPVAWRDRLDVAAAGASERLRRLRGSPGARRRAVAVRLLALGAVAVAVVATASVRAGTPTRPASSSGPLGLDRPLSGSIHLTVQRRGATTTYRGTCTASGGCVLAPAFGGTLGTVVVTLDPTTGAVLGVQGPSLPVGTVFTPSTTAP